MTSIEDLLGGIFGDVDAEAYRLGQQRAARVAAGIPKDAEGPWDGALTIARDAKAVAKRYRRLAA